MIFYYDVYISDFCYFFVYFKFCVFKGDNFIDVLIGKFLDFCVYGSDFIVED